ncbi:BTAD domain-containing putative transcriptional regulator [Paenibacillus chartarius]|uniref:BTAD domain-containing putative transcriptional regulator n=1 Tax=Paenibacillus chartarius TaxID=747481 RepID=A0ABV6DFP3_9BACL
MKAGTVLKTKLTPPQAKKKILRRASLARKLKRIGEHPLTLVQSGPGFGKSTAVAAHLRDSAAGVCWYTIGARDDDLYPFMTYIVHAVRERHPQFGMELLGYLGQGEHYVREKELYLLFDSFLNELASIEEEVICVLDDYHLVEHVETIDQFLQYWLQHMPAAVHLVLLSRTRPEWAGLTAMRVRGELLELTEADLAFSEEEIEVLFTDCYEYPISAEEAQHIYRTTEGWAIAVQLIWQRLLLTGSDLKAVLSDPALTMEELFRFLVQEVFQKQTPDIRRFLMQSSILEELTADACDRVLERSDSRPLLAKLCSQSLFLFHLGGGHYRYHALFRNFLYSRLNAEPDAYRQLLRRAAVYYESVQLYRAALDCLSAAEEPMAAGRLLERCGAALIERGQLETMLDWLRRLPDDVKDGCYRLRTYEGEVYRYRCLYEKALSAYALSERLAAQAGDGLGRALALEGQARVYLDTIQPGLAGAYLQQAIELLEAVKQPHSPGRPRSPYSDSVSPGELLTRLYGLMAENLVNSGRAAAAEAWFAKSRGRRETGPEDQLEVRLHLRTGRLKHAKRLAERMLHEARTQGASSRASSPAPLSASPLPRSHRELELLLALIEAMLGRPEPAKQLAEAGMLLGIRLNAPFVEAVGWMRMGHSAQLLPKYDPEVAVRCYQAAQEIMERLDVPRGKAEPLMGLCLLYGREGAYELAVQYGEEALEATLRVEDEWLSGYIRIALGIAAFHAERWQEADAVFSGCGELFLRCGDSYGVSAALLWQAMLAYRLEQDDRFRSVMERLLQMLQNGGYDELIQKRTLFGPRDVQQLAPLLIEAQKLRLESGYVSMLLTGLGMEHMTYHPGYTLRIETLGGFRVWLGERELEEKDWQRGKAKELFQLLVVKRQHLLPKEELLAALYPDADEKGAARDFKVALNALNMALEPHRRARSSPFFIQRHGSSYGLNLAAGFELDAVEFESRVKAGLEEPDGGKARGLLERGLELYRGDYMPDRRYEDWCIEERERLSVLYLRGAERLAKLLVQAGEWDRAIRWCESIVQKDSCWEEAYRLLMLCHLRQGSRSQASRWYQKCCQALEREMGVEPMSATRELYVKLLDADVTHL